MPGAIAEGWVRSSQVARRLHESPTSCPAPLKGYRGPAGKSNATFSIRQTERVFESSNQRLREG